MKTKRLFSIFSTVLGLSVVICLGSLTALAQTGTTTIRGIVKDPQGNVVSGAKVTVSNATKNFSRTQVTGDDGSYVFSALPPDTYSMDAEASGFKKANVPEVRALVDTTKDLDIQLEVGAVTETITVTSGIEAPLNSTDASIGTAFESRRIQELPLNARNIVGLLSLQPGVTREGEVNGSRRDQANITLDGVDVNEQQTGLDVVNGTNRAANIQGDAFASVLRMTPDSVQEFRVTTSNPNSTQGRSSGGQVSLVTKSGTNDFHGSLFEYHRNTVTTSNDFFNNARGRFVADDPEVISGEKLVGDERVPRPKLIRNIFGGTLGGPILKDRFYFFYSFEGRRDAAEESVVRDVPTATLRQGTVRYRCIVGAANPLCPASGIRTLTPADIASIYPATGGVNPAGLAILQTAPLPNDFSLGDGLNRAGFRFNAPISVELETHTARLDFTLTDRQSIFARGNYQNDLYGRAPRFPTTPAPNLWVNPRGFVVGHSWTLTNTLVNNARVGLTRAGVTQQGDSSDNSIGFRDVFVPFTYARGLQRTTPVWNITDDVSWVKGSHTIQFGTNMRFIRNDRTSFANSFDAALVNFSFYASSGSSILNPAPTDRDPSFNRDYGTAVAAVLGRYSQYTIAANFDKSGQPLAPGSPSVRSLATQEYDFYAQDVWKVTPNLTLNFGLRYGQETPVYERNGFQLVPNTNLGDFLERRIAGAAAGTPLNESISFNLGGRANNAPDFYTKDKNNYAPHIGVAWSPDFGDNAFGRLIGRNGRSVFRGGFRILYDHIAGQLAVDAENENSFGFAASNTNGSSSTNVTTLLGPLVSGFNPNVRTFPRVTLPASLTFPLSFPADETDRIVAGLDQSIVSPRHYTWNFSYGREIGKGLSFEASYIGRKA
ncbi:MAG: TonB-dependent receptor, partial [Pyrinomonadaceae bacterium]